MTTKLIVLPSGHGDCLMLESGGKRMLIDGGVSKDFREHVLPYLTETADRPIDCLYLSHIDNDHIGGLLVLTDAMYDHAVWEYRTSKGEVLDEPPRVPAIRKVWHNAFTDLLKENATPVASALGAAAAILSGVGDVDGDARNILDMHDNLATGYKEALTFSARIGDGQLGIEVNPEYDAALMLVDANPPELALGKATFTLLGPFAEDLEVLRKKWNEWLRANQAKVRDLRRRSRADAEELTSSAENFIAPLETEAWAYLEELLPEFTAKEHELGLRRKVTPPNLASLMFLVEGDKTILLTGDGHTNEVYKGLQERRKLDDDGTLHVDVLKVPHHGAEFNITPDFARKVTAKHYVFCGNGFAGNPEKVVLKTIVEERAKSKKKKSPYKFWFNSLPNNEHMKMIEEEVEKHAAASGGKLTYEFLEDRFEVK